MTVATDSAPASRIHATVVSGRRSSSTSPTQAGVPIPTTSAKADHSSSGTSAPCAFATAAITMPPASATSVQAAMATASGRAKRCTSAILSHTLATRHGASPECLRG